MLTSYTGVTKVLIVIIQLELFSWWNFLHAIILEKWYSKPDP